MQGDIEGRSYSLTLHSTHSLVHYQHSNAYVRMCVGVTLEAKFSSGILERNAKDWSTRAVVMNYLKEMETSN